MMIIDKIAWIALALIHALPALAFFRPTLLSKLYGVSPGTSLSLLMQHRAALFLILFVICLWAIMAPEVRRLSSIALAISMISFLGLYVVAGNPAALRSIAVADVIGLPALAWVLWRAFAYNS